MLRVLAILAIGLALGYTYGFADARDHIEPLPTRVAARLAGETVRLVEEHPAATGSTQARMRNADEPERSSR